MRTHVVRERRERAPPTGQPGPAAEIILSWPCPPTRPEPSTTAKVAGRRIPAPRAQRECAREVEQQGAPREPRGAEKSASGSRFTRRLGQDATFRLPVPPAREGRGLTERTCSPARARRSPSANERRYARSARREARSTKTTISNVLEEILEVRRYSTSTRTSTAPAPREYRVRFRRAWGNEIASRVRARRPRYRFAVAAAESGRALALRFLGRGAARPRWSSRYDGDRARGDHRSRRGQSDSW
jgi:hypothetical protein